MSGAELSRDGTLLCLRGHVDWDDCERLRDAGAAAIAALPDDSEMVRIDTSGLERPESRVVAVMLSWLRAAHARDLRMVLVEMPESLVRILEFTGLDEVFDVNAGAVGT